MRNRRIERYIVRTEKRNEGMERDNWNEKMRKDGI
jgi:hypothetical protein